MPDDTPNTAGSSTSRSPPARVAPAVSAIIPLYNKQASVRRAVESVLNQSVRDLELIVVDDGSRDDGPRIVEAIGDPRIHLVRQANAGPGAARNRGLALARGRFVAFLDADDEWLAGFLEQALEALGRHPEAGAFAANHLRGEQALNLRDLWEARGIGEGLCSMPPDLSVEQLKSHLYYMHSSSVVCPIGVVRRYGGYYQRDRCTWGEDGYLWVQVLLNYPVYRTLEPLAWYHMEDSSLYMGRKDFHPPDACVLDPQPLRQQCPGPYRDLMERYLCHTAIRAARRLAGAGQYARARKLLKAYPPTTTLHRAHAKAWLAVQLAPLRHALRSIGPLRRLKRRLDARRKGD